MGEDAVITYPIIAVSSCIVVDNEFKPYHYRVVQDSMSRAYDELYFERAVELFKNLKINLALNETMQKDLQYYALFIIEIGINQLLSRNCKLRFRKKIEKIRWMWQQMEMLGLFKETNWFGFKPGAKKRAEYFIEGHIMKLVLYTCCQKIICKLGGYR
jgi:hypothetical protein